MRFAGKLFLLGFLHLDVHKKEKGHSVALKVRVGSLRKELQCRDAQHTIEVFIQVVVFAHTLFE